MQIDSNIYSNNTNTNSEYKKVESKDSMWKPAPIFGISQ